MLRFLVLVSFGVASVLAITEECLKDLGPDVVRCCKAPLLKFSSPPVPLDECFENRNKSASGYNCEIAQCIAMKRGFLADDGTINKKALEAVYSEGFKERAKLVENVVKNCINGDVNLYGPEDNCEVMKIQNCVNVQYALSCPDFEDKGHCSGIKVLVEKCTAE